MQQRLKVNDVRNPDVQKNKTKVKINAILKKVQFRTPPQQFNLKQMNRY